jgi:hypothetical protein
MPQSKSSPVAAPETRQTGVSVRTLLRQRAVLRTKTSVATTATAPASGWVAYTVWTNDTGKPITSFETSWIVPDPPKAQAQQIIYLFNSLEIPQVRILQPVLLWGTVSDVPETGDFWTIASWWVGEPDQPFLLTSPIRVEPGEKLTGRITMYQQENSLCDYTCEFVGRPGTKLIAGSLPEFLSCTETLEAYYIGSDDDYPATTQTDFTGIALQVDGGSTQPVWAPEGTFKPNIVTTPAGSEVQIVYPRNEA